jgi:hypothetical protein
MANTIQLARGTAAPSSLAKSELAIRHRAFNPTAANSSMLYIGEDAGDDGVTVRSLGIGMAGDSGQGGVSIGNSITFTGGTNITTVVSGAGVTHGLTNNSLTYNAGTGMTGGGSVALGSSATINVIGGTGITANANDIALTNTSVTYTAGTGLSGGGTVALGSSATFNNTGVTSIVAGSNISISGPTGAVTITASGEANVDTDLSKTVSGSGYSINSSTGDNIALSIADTDNWGLMSDEMFDKLAGIETSATADQTVNTGDIADVSVTQTELAELQTLGSTSISSTNWTALSNLTGTNSGDSNTQNEYATSWVDSTNDVLLRLTESGAGSGTQDIKLVAGSNISLTPSGANMTIAATGEANVDTNLSKSVSGTGYSINSSTGDNIALSIADTDNWGLMSDEMFDTLAAATTNTGTVTSVDDGNGLTGGAITTTGSLAVGAGTGITVNTNDVAVTAAQTGITSIYATDLIIGEDSQTAIDFGTANEIDFKAANNVCLTLNATTLYPVTNNQISLGTSSLKFANIYVDGKVYADETVGPLTGEVTGNASTATKIASITNSDIVQLTTSQTLTNKQLTACTAEAGFTMGSGLMTVDAGTKQLRIQHSTGSSTATDFFAQSNGSLSMDVTAGDFEIEVNDGNVILTKSTTEFGRFAESSSDFVISSAISDYDMIFKGNDGGSTITALTLDMSAAGKATFNNNIVAGGIITAGSAFTIGSAAITEAELELLDNISAGTAAATKVVTTDSNKDTTGFRNITLSGELDAGSLDISGNADIDGTLETDNLTIGGSQGSDGQVLTSTGSGVGWESVSGGSGDITDVVAGTGMTGGASSGSATVNVIGGTGITANADDIAIDSTVVTKTGSHTLTNKTLTQPIISHIDSGSTITLDATTDIILDALGSQIYFKKDGTERFQFDLDSTPTMEVTGDFEIDCTGHLTMDVEVDKDIFLKEDGQARIQFLLDNSPSLAATGVFTIDGNSDISIDASDDIMFKKDGTTLYTFKTDGTPEIDIVGDFKLDGTAEIEIESGGTSDIKLDSAGDIILDYADGDSIILKNASTFPTLDISGSGSGTDVTFQILQNGGNIKFKQYDGRTLLDIDDAGHVAIRNGATGSGELRIYEDTDAGSNYAAIKVPSISTSYTLTLPPNDGSNGQFLKSDGSGGLSWSADNNDSEDTTFTLAGDSGTSLISHGNTLTINGTAPISTAINSTDTMTISLDANGVNGTHLALGSDADGDMMYYNGTNYIRIAVGADNHVLTLNGTTPGWEAGGGGGSSLTVGSDNQVPFVNGAGDDLEYASDFTFNGANFNVGSGNGGTETLTVDGTRSTITIGNSSANIGTAYNIYESGTTSLRVGSNTDQSVVTGVAFQADPFTGFVIDVSATTVTMNHAGGIYYGSS